MKKLIPALSISCLIASNAGAAQLLFDPFDYTSGALLAPTDGSAGLYNSTANAGAGDNWYYGGASPNTPPGIANSGLNFTDVSAPGYASLLATTGNSVQYDTTQNASARIQLLPTAVNAGTDVGIYYYSYLLKVNTLDNMTVNLNGLFLASFNNSAGAAATQLSQGSALTRLKVDGTDNSKFDLGIAKTTATGSGLAYSSGLTVGDTIFVVASYEFTSGANSDIVSMWINPDANSFSTGIAPAADLTASSASIADQNLLSIALRNVNTVGNPAFQLDELRVGTTWADVVPVAVPEPASVGVLGLGLLALFGQYRARRR